MAKAKVKRKKSTVTKVLDASTILIAVSPIIKLLIEGRAEEIPDKLALGTLEGSRSVEEMKDMFIQMYGPMLGAILFRKMISQVRKVARV